ncbi:MAG: hypothetical protein QOF65_2125, partial [Thermoleophilaceae bacterium]|nr:hypothetical protein [Thermoleophilaceae bacterium]
MTATAQLDHEFTAVLQKSPNP